MLYYGDKEIKQTLKNKIIFKDGAEELVSPKMLKYVITTKKSDLTELRDLRVKPVVEALLEVLLEWDIKTSELDYTWSLLITSLNDNLKAADECLWGVDNENKNMSIIDKVLSTHYKNKYGKGKDSSK